MKKVEKKSSLITQLAKRKAEENAKAQAFGKFHSTPSRYGNKPLLGPSWGGRNGQGKP